MADAGPARLSFAGEPMRNPVCGLLPRKPPYLYVSSRYISWMTPKRGRGWLENASPLEMAVEESPLGPL
jgi:hypothetical protein